jgi:HlyD family secretion protein
MNKKLIWIIGILVVVVVMMIVLKKTGVIGKEEGVKVTAEKAEKRTITETVTASGKISPEIEVKVSPDISGEVVELFVAEGDSVKRGQIVAKIYADIYASQRDQAAAGVAQSQAAEANAKAQIVALEANLQQATATYDRQKKLFDEKVISKAEFEQAEQTYKSSQANYSAAKEGIKGNLAAIQSAKANLSRADKDVSRATITAPMSGVVNILNVKKGERVAGNSFNVGTEIMRIADLGSIVAQVDVGENDIPKVKYGDTAIITVDAYGSRKFKGVVFKIANPSSSSLSGVASTTEVTNYKVHVRLLQNSYSDLMGSGKPFPFRPNMSATADIQTRTEVNVLSVPLAAVTTREVNKENPVAKKTDEKSASTSDAKSTSVNDDLEEVVFVLDSSKVKKLRVKTAIQDLNYIQIIEGLKGNEEVITGPYNLLSKTLKEGDKVKVVSKDMLYEEKKKD